MSYGGSTAPTSCAPSQCGDSTDTVTPDAAGRRVSQLQHLAAVAESPLAPARTSRVYQSSAQSHSLSGSSSATTFQAQRTVESRSDHFQTRAPALQRTHSFIQVPRTLPEGHTISTLGIEDPTSEDLNRDLIVDETSPSEDERFAESVIRAGGY